MDQYGWSKSKNKYPTQNPEWALSHVLQEGSSKKVVKGIGGRGKKWYPEKSGAIVQDCVHYMRTGDCSYGVKCNFNHPKDRDHFVGDFVPPVGGVYPERLGEQECKFYLRTGTCHFGMKCRFHHPKNLQSEVPLNVYGYPLRPGEKECSYYMQTGLCKFGMACIFHHPQPAGSSSTSVPPSPPAAAVYVLQSPLPDPYAPVFTAYKPPRPPLVVSPYVQDPNGAMLQISLANWNAYQQGVINPSPLSPPLGAKHDVQAMVRSEGYHLPFGTTYLKQQKLPERAGEEACRYYMKNGFCNYGTSCMYYHPPPPRAAVTRMYCFLNPLGLPFRPGVEPCKFYLRYGSCKFGQNCRFDHPMGGGGGAMMQYSPSPPPPPTTSGGFLSVPYPVAEINFVRGRDRRYV